MEPTSTDPCDWTAGEIARAIAAREISAQQVTQTFLRRIDAVNPQLNAVVVPLYDQALAAAAEADRKQARGEPLGPLHGVPITVKECYHVADTPSCIGLASLRDKLEPSDCLLVQRLRSAGVILLGKTNVPQLMLWHECDNPVYGRTNNPWDLGRTPGGSTGGEGAIIAARGSPWGLGDDLGGSIRLPAHFCGLCGFKPTAHRLPHTGTTGGFQGMEAVVAAPGPLARSARDLELMLRVLGSGPSDTPSDPPTVPFESATIDVAKLRIGWWIDDGVFPASPALQRAVREAAEALAARGAQVIPYQPRGLAEFFDTYLGLMGADGGDHAQRNLGRDPRDWRLAKLHHLARLPDFLRWPLVASLRWSGQEHFARLVKHARPTSASGYWQLTHRLRQLQAAFWQQAREAQIDVFLCPPHGLPAMPHRKPIDLVSAASYAFLANCLDAPAGVVPVTRVRADEESSRPASRDQVLRQAAATDRGSAGLPVSVQVLAAPWRDETVLAVLQAIEDACLARPDFPLRTRVPAEG